MDTLKHYLPLCWFTLNPLELIRSVSFFKNNLIFYFIVEFFLQANMTDDPIESFYEVSFETLLTLLFIWVMLGLNRSLYGFIQVTAAVVFCSNLVSFFIIPVLVWLTISENTISYYLVGILLVWDYALTTYIFKRVLVLNIPASAVVSLIYAGFTYFGAYTLGQLVQ
ncbi:hypothetical protein [Methylovulum psychrotolerans]|uniref:Yip1 domain-containing protein n=1 Tax=Methylovulum psychrotolerans TaxID=1704499 RepID=A0A2S5CJF0_9GAMM|nr:hypothetical protein [Methylovulum psychrotolerans]POZ50929.1 hypothetical protein AADEFJLK_03401 [Methylovulum psychrotolerans]